jgi:hypothetical protein
MSTLRLAAVAVLLAAACGPAAAERAAADDPPAVAAPAAADPGAPVLLELFTSQGCSSCPPADRLLSELAAEAGGGEVVALAFHVDYWNYIGWTDPFSSERWSQRQRRYAEVLDDGRVYTPQLVVNGRRHLVGSRRDDVLRAVREARSRPPAARLDLAVGEAAGGTLPVDVAARLLRDAGEGPLVLWVALWQDGLVTPVSGGENADRVLRDDRVVRRLLRAAELAAEAGTEAAMRVELPLDADWPRDDLGVAAFLQAPGAGPVHGAAAVRLADAPPHEEPSGPASR